MFAKTLRGALCSFWGAVILLGSGQAFAEYPLNLTEGVTTTSKTIYDLHMLIFWICVIACVATFAVLIYSIFTHRKSKGAVPATFHESTTVEIIWTTIPFLVLVGMAVPATKALLAGDADVVADIYRQRVVARASSALVSGVGYQDAALRASRNMSGKASAEE